MSIPKCLRCGKDIEMLVGSAVVNPKTGIGDSFIVYECECGATYYINNQTHFIEVQSSRPIIEILDNKSKFQN